jgi:hypothetical protein
VLLVTQPLGERRVVVHDEDDLVARGDLSSNSGEGLAQERESIVVVRADDHRRLGMRLHGSEGRRGCAP